MKLDFPFMPIRYREMSLPKCGYPVRQVSQAANAPEDSYALAAAMDGLMPVACISMK
jgi:hypothetical protein